MDGGEGWDFDASYSEHVGFVFSDSRQCIVLNSWILSALFISGSLSWGGLNSLRSSFSGALICSAAGATLWFLLLRSRVVQADTCTHFGCGCALDFSTAWQSRLYKPRWQKIRIVCYYNASLQWLERALFWLWEQSTVAIKEPPSLPPCTAYLLPSNPLLFPVYLQQGFL